MFARFETFKIKNCQKFQKNTRSDMKIQKSHSSSIGLIGSISSSLSIETLKWGWTSAFQARTSLGVQYGCIQLYITLQVCPPKH